MNIDFYSVIMIFINNLWFLQKMSITKNTLRTRKETEQDRTLIARVSSPPPGWYVLNTSTPDSSYANKTTTQPTTYNISDLTFSLVNKFKTLFNLLILLLVVLLIK